MRRGRGDSAEAARGITGFPVLIEIDTDGHRSDKGWILVDAGWMALSRDRGTARQRVDQGYGVVCDQDGRAISGLVVTEANQEHGIVARRDGGTPPGLVVGSRELRATWTRFGGW